jgi:hypothetical protein
MQRIAITIVGAAFMLFAAALLYTWLAPNP